MRGKVKWFNEDTGYGFISGEDGKDIFVHYSAISKKGYKSLKDSSEVEYELIETDHGLQAKNVVELEKTTV